MNESIQHVSEYLGTPWECRHYGNFRFEIVDVHGRRVADIGTFNGISQSRSNAIAQLLTSAALMREALEAVDLQAKDAGANGAATIPSEIFDLVQQAIEAATFRENSR